jgi:hypothetical protein
MIENFNNINDFDNISTRNKFKIQSNNLLWITILEIIKELKLCVEIEKVKAHDKDVYNNYVDYLATEAHKKIDELILDIKYQNVESLRWIPKWNNIPIDMNLRKFVTLMTNVNNLESFLNLNRNSKYRRLNVNWEITFNNLNSSEDYFYTTFAESKFKRQKIKLLIEELSTIEQLKKSYFIFGIVMIVSKKLTIYYFNTMKYY